MTRQQTVRVDEKQVTFESKPFLMHVECLGKECALWSTNTPVGDSEGCAFKTIATVLMTTLVLNNT